MHYVYKNVAIKAVFMTFCHKVTVVCFFSDSQCIYFVCFVSCLYRVCACLCALL